MRVHVTNGARNGLNIGRKVGPCPGGRGRWVLGRGCAFSQALYAENTHTVPGSRLGPDLPIPTMLQREKERNHGERTPRPCSVCGARRLSRRGDRRLVGARFGRWREETVGRARCLTLPYSLPLSVWVHPLAEHIMRNYKTATCILIIYMRVRICVSIYPYVYLFTPIYIYP